MKNLYNKFAPERLKLKLSPYAKQVSNFLTLSRNYGQFQSLRSCDSIGPDGIEVPWYTYPALEYLNQFDFSDKVILEYGGGNSTLWWSRRSQKIISIESNRGWFDRISASKSETCVYVLAEQDDEYVSRKELFESDVVIIDGILRADCALYLTENAKYLQESVDIVVFDNSDWYQDTLCQLNNDLGWVQVDFMGFGPINGYCWATSILINPARSIERNTSIAPIRRRNISAL